MTIIVFVTCVAQNQTAKNIYSDLRSTLWAETILVANIYLQVFDFQLKNYKKGGITVKKFT